VTICEKVVVRLNEHDDVIEYKFMKIAPPRNEELVAPLLSRDYNIFSFSGNRTEQLHAVQPLPSCATVSDKFPSNTSLRNNQGRNQGGGEPNNCTLPELLAKRLFY